jgi:hypothetical protein
MAKKPLKIDQLAKLRQFKPGTDPGEFLSTQWRQVARALEQAYVVTEDSTATTTQGINKNPGFFAVDTTTRSSSGTITFSNSAIVDDIGSVTGNYLFVPTTNGKFYIEASAEWIYTGTSPMSGTITYNSSLNIKAQSGSTLASTVLQYVMAPAYTEFDTIPHNVAAIADLTTTNGVYFNCSLSGSNIRNLNFKIFRIGD